MNDLKLVVVGAVVDGILVGWPVGILPSMLYTSIPILIKELEESLIVALSVARAFSFRPDSRNSGISYSTVMCVCKVIVRVLHDLLKETVVDIGPESAG